jgi:hypothetical protein
MNPIIYKTYPRLFILGTAFMGSVFFGLLSWLVWKSSGVNKTSVAYIFIIFFALGSIISFYYFITIRIIKLSVERLAISYFMLPFSRTFLLSEIQSISQTSRVAEASGGRTGSITFTVIMTTIQLNDGKEIKLQTVGQLDFKELEKGFRKCKFKDGHFTPGKRTFLNYLLDDIGGLGWVVLQIILAIGLTYGLLTQK